MGTIGRGHSIARWPDGPTLAATDPRGRDASTHAIPVIRGLAKDLEHLAKAQPKDATFGFGCPSFSNFMDRSHAEKGRAGGLRTYRS